jgi:hypothetical protein
VTAGGFSPKRLARVRHVLERHVDACGPHPAYAPRACARRVISLGRLGRELRMARHIRHRLVLLDFWTAAYQAIDD